MWIHLPVVASMCGEVLTSPVTIESSSQQPAAPRNNGVALQPLPDPWYMDEPIFGTQEETAAVVHRALLPIVASQQSAATSSVSDVVGHDAFPGGDHDDWLQRAHEATAQSSLDARPIRSTRPSSRSRSPRDRAVQVPLYAGPLYFLSGIGVGEACREALCGPRRDGLALFNLQSGTMTFPEVELACRRRALREIRRGVCFYFGITEHPARRWTEHQADNHIWQSMIVLMQAESSFDTSALERILIREYSQSVLCLNFGPGGERASAGTPHYCYMLVAEEGPLRRPPRRPNR